MNREWACSPIALRRSWTSSHVHPDEPRGLRQHRTSERSTAVTSAAAFPRDTWEPCSSVAGFGVTTVDVSEIAKAEGAVTCCSLIFESQKRPDAIYQH